jgi:ribose 5-phosphate isomerase B
VAREHNDANVLALGARMIGASMAEACLDAFLTTPFGSGRHEKRVAMLGRSSISVG